MLDKTMCLNGKFFIWTFSTFRNFLLPFEINRYKKLMIAKGGLLRISPLRPISINCKRVDGIEAFQLQNL